MEAILKIFVDPKIDTSDGVRVLCGGVGGWWFLILLVCAAAFCIWSYLRIDKPVQRNYRILMIATRLAMLMVLFL